MPHKVVIHNLPIVVDGNGKQVPKSKVLKITFGENAICTADGTSYVLNGKVTATVEVAGKQFTIPI